jgi:hypothetical protein
MLNPNLTFERLVELWNSTHERKVTFDKVFDAANSLWLNRRNKLISNN